MELLRVLRKSVVFIAIFLGIIIWLSIFKINNTNDKKVYAYYNQLMYEYANQTEMIESLTYSKYVHDKTDDYEADREYIEEAIKLLQEKYQYVYSSDMSRAENNYKKLLTVHYLQRSKVTMYLMHKSIWQIWKAEGKSISLLLTLLL